MSSAHHRNKDVDGRISNAGGELELFFARVSSCYVSSMHYLRGYKLSAEALSEPSSALLFPCSHVMMMPGMAGPSHASTSKVGKATLPVMMVVQWRFHTGNKISRPRTRHPAPHNHGFLAQKGSRLALPQSISRRFH